MDQHNQLSLLSQALRETVDDMRRVSVMDAITHANITLRHLGDNGEVGRIPIRGNEDRKA